MSFINRVCDKVFVINLENDKERLNHFDNQMKANQIMYERFDAILGKNVLRDNRLSEYCNTFCTDAMKGCALSNRSIWEIMIKNDYENIIIFEDDIEINNNFDNDFKHIWNFIPKDYDIVYLGTPFGINENDTLLNKVYTTIHGHTAEEINKYTLKIKGSVGAYGYMLSLKGAKNFLQQSIEFHIDAQIMYWIRKYNLISYAVNPQIVEANVDNSSISDSYPLLLNTVLQKIHLNNKITLNWLLGENFIKLGPFNINPLIVILFIISFFVSNNIMIVLYLWLTLEFLYSLDFKNTFRFAFIISLPRIFFKI